MFKSVSELIDVDNFKACLKSYGAEGPFDHCVIDNFFKPEVAAALEAEFPGFDDEVWHQYDNPIEIKKVSNIWNTFPPLTYNTFNVLNSPEFLQLLSDNALGGMKLYADNGLNGGGWHMHKKGGKLNTHLDYSLHPKLGLQRKLNIIIYMNSNWQEDWGGSLGLWGNETDEKPGDLEKSVPAIFNRAVIFDTTQNSWHGLPEPLTCPDDETRRSLAAYFLCDAPEGVDERGKALFAPTKEQEGDTEILDLIKKRSNVQTAASVYGKK
ncbi:2OG-Fe(II) oxygenase [Algicella marina]|uniref:2OG-Fe(II) oxygenase n=1 Tax=Algicella marina TaxID=2683284 RepID=A0A6P1T5H4_9RHOB|nr:2OG-Fe(II) oxygenase [Algicella marina]QHQ36923.1 2OG-Fe(II) oxygenase [Algicella marina]